MEKIRKRSNLGIRWTLGIVSISSVICVELFNGRDVNGVGKTLKYFGRNSLQNTQSRYNKILGTCNVGTLTRRIRDEGREGGM